MELKQYWISIYSYSFYELLCTATVIMMKDHSYAQFLCNEELGREGMLMAVLIIIKPTKYKTVLKF